MVIFGNGVEMKKKIKPVQVIFRSEPAMFNTLEDLERAVKRLKRWANPTPNRRKPRKRRSPKMPFHLESLQHKMFQRVRGIDA